MRTGYPGPLVIITSFPATMNQGRNIPKFTTRQLKLHLADSSRALADLTANMVYEAPELFSLLIDVALTGERLFAQRASRVVSICSSRFPELLKPHYSRIIRELKNLKDEGAIRNLLKIISEVPLKLSSREKSILVNLCYDYLVSGKYAVAIKVYSMQVLYNLSKEIPEIGDELSRILEDQLPDETPGYRSRANRILGRMRRL